MSATGTLYLTLLDGGENPKLVDFVLLLRGWDWRRNDSPVM
jgi:hypothetical protein